MGRENELAYAELCSCLYDQTLTLIYSLEILRCDFESEEKPQIVRLYTELTNLLMTDGEQLADYLAHVEKIVAALNRTLRLAMMFKGLTDEYNPFSMHVTQTSEALIFAEFRTRLRCFECTLRYRSIPRSDEIMIANCRMSYQSSRKGIEMCLQGRVLHL